MAGKKATTLNQLKEALLQCASTVAAAALDAVRDLDSRKADKPAPVSITIPVSGWSGDNTERYPCYYDIAVSGVTASDKADVILSASSMNAALSCGLCPTSETRTGAIRVRAMTVPETAIQAACYITGSAEVSAG